MIAGLVLCGGRSRRMGADKSSLPLADGRTFAAAVAAVLGEVCDEVWLSVRADQPAPLPHFETVIDAGSGPLGGLAAGLSRLASVDGGATGVLLAVAVDMPDVERSLLAELVALVVGGSGGVDAAVPVAGGVAQVACAAWAARLAGAAEQLVTAGEGALRSLLDVARDVRLVQADQFASGLVSYDTPDALSSRGLLAVNVEQNSRPIEAD